MADLAREIARNLWPIWDRQSESWVGDAAKWAVELTQADLELLDSLRARLETRIDARRLNGTHQEFFEEEDGFVIDPTECRFRRVGESYGKYDHKLPARALDKVRTTFARDGIAASGEVDLALKQYLQRPRAYQVAALFGRHGYSYEWAKTAVSPSLVSGHCLDASIAGCYTYLKCKNVLPGDAAQYWAQFTVDMGDRRVFAGVHYPADNISSWFCALRIAGYIFRGRAREAKNFLWDAIQQRSAVYAAITTAAQAEPFSPYSGPLKWLADEARAKPGV